MHLDLQKRHWINLVFVLGVFIKCPQYKFKYKCKPLQFKGGENLWKFQVHK